MKTFLLFCLCAMGLGVTAQNKTNNIPSNKTDSSSVSNKEKVTFKLSATHAKNVMVRGDWSGPAVQMIKNEKDVWTADILLKPQIYGYTFVVDGVKTIDPKNTELKLGRVATASALEVPGSPAMPWEMWDVPHGNITSISYNSKTAQDQRRVMIYTPPGYQPDQLDKLPVLYLLHGNGGNENIWTNFGKAHFIADNLLAQGLIEPMIIVMPRGHTYKPGETVPEGERPTNVFEEDLLNTIVPLIEKSFRAKTDQANRAIMGLSMGGYQAYKIGLDNLDLFSQVGVYSASANIPELLTELSENPKSVNEKLKLLWIACGRLDQRFEGAQKLDKDLTKAGIQHTFKPTDGAHNWINWREYLVEALPLLFK